MMVQSRISPVSSPMRRPSGSGSVGMGSPMPDRPQSVENPLTPRSTGSGPLTPGGQNMMGCHGMDSMPSTPHPPGSMDNTSYNNMEGNGMENASQQQQQQQHMQNYMSGSPNYSCAPTNVTHTDYNNMSGGGGGGINSNVIPFPTFSWFSGSGSFGLKGGSPFSVVQDTATEKPPEQPTPSNNNSGNNNATVICVSDNRPSTSGTCVVTSVGTVSGHTISASNSVTPVLKNAVPLTATSHQVVPSASAVNDTAVSSSCEVKVVVPVPKIENSVASHTGEAPVFSQLLYNLSLPTSNDPYLDNFFYCLVLK